METRLWSGEVKREGGGDRDWRTGISRRLQRQPEHEIGATGELGCVRCSRAGQVQNGRWDAFGEKGSRCKGRAGPHSGNVETRESDRLVCERIWDRAGVDEFDEYRGKAVAGGF